MEKKYESEEIKEEAIKLQGLKSEISKVIVGQSYVVDRIIIGLLCNGHVLLEGVPGLAKTTLVKTVSDAIDLDFKRIQFTPDLLPADLIGTLVYNPKTHEFQTRKGPVFTNIVLADEINRASAKVQSALLEAMQERQVTIGENSFPLGKPFMVFATQNPIDQEGTYHLPEAQVDRFIFKLILNHLEREDEKEVLTRASKPSEVKAILKAKEVLALQDMVNHIYIDDKVVDYILNIVFATREPRKFKMDIDTLIEYGASPRASLALHLASRAHAFLKKRHFVIPEDVKAVAPDILRHRILLTYEAEADNISSDEIIEKILMGIPTP
ncbi:MoxR family ATPase [bacterium]|jgi:MoxR-like ATPase|nr:MoxR family ATPase [bacterium]